MGVEYFFVWIGFGMVALPLGVAGAAIGMQQAAVARTVPLAAGVVVAAGLFLVARAAGLG